MTTLYRPIIAEVASDAAAEKQEASRHIPALDGLRGLAILLVLFHHITLQPGMMLANAVGWDIGALGVSGVDLFFVLSGFLITGILVDSKQAPHYFRNFYARRTLRIFPLYYAVVFLSLVILPNLPLTIGRLAPVEGGWAYWLYLSNFTIAQHGEFKHGILDVAWSLAIEEQFYLLWPIIVLLLSRRGLMILCGVLLGLGIMLRIGMVWQNVHWVTIYVLTPCRMDGLLIGSFLALATRSVAVDRLVRPGWIAGAICALLMLLILLQGAEYFTTPLGQCFGPTLVSGIYAAVLLTALSRGGGNFVARGLNCGWLRTCGKYSYALYLVHVPVLTTLYLVIQRFEAPRWAAWDTVLGQVLFALSACAIAFALSWMSWHLFEKHFLVLKRYFPSNRSPTIPAAAHVWQPTPPPQDPQAHEMDPECEFASSPMR